MVDAAHEGIHYGATGPDIRPPPPFGLPSENVMCLLQLLDLKKTLSCTAFFGFHFVRCQENITYGGRNGTKKKTRSARYVTISWLKRHYHALLFMVSIVVIGCQENITYGGSK